MKIFRLFVKSGGKIFCGHRNIVPMSAFYVRAKKIRFLKLSKLRYPKAFRLITFIALLVTSVNPLEYGQSKAFKMYFDQLPSMVRQALNSFS